MTRSLETAGILLVTVPVVESGGLSLLTGDHTMSRLIYSAIASLDGFVADEKGNFDWSDPDEEGHSFINDLEREVGIYLYGRGLYDVMAAWEELTLEEQPPHMKDLAQIWRGAEKIIYSKTLQSVSTGKARIQRDFDPAGDPTVEVVVPTRPDNRPRAGESRLQGWADR